MRLSSINLYFFIYNCHAPCHEGSSRGDVDLEFPVLRRVRHSTVRLGRSAVSVIPNTVYSLEISMNGMWSIYFGSACLPSSLCPSTIPTGGQLLWGKPWNISQSVDAPFTYRTGHRSLFPSTSFLHALYFKPISS